MNGTSRQALESALLEMDSVHVWHHPSVLTIFHPKLYLLEGLNRGVAFVGSNNLTSSGLQTNAEASVRLQYELPLEAAAWKEAQFGWDQLQAHPNSVKLTSAVLKKLDDEGFLADEAEKTYVVSKPSPKTPPGLGGAPLFPATPVKPPSPLPSGVKAPTKPVTKKIAKAGPTATPSITVVGTVAQALPQALIIQIVPHHNGEIFLSKIAVNQHPDFFGFPFTGMTTPKKAGNSPYPQRSPDPVTDWTIYGKADQVAYTLPQFSLNMVYYENKGEIRITVPPEFAKKIAPLSILEMVLGDPGSGANFVCSVFSPNSKQYKALLPALTASMPSGGSPTPRRFGWI